MVDQIIEDKDNKQVVDDNAVKVEDKSAEEVLYPDKDVKVEEKPDAKVEDKAEIVKDEVVKEDKPEAQKVDDELKLTVKEGSALSETDISAVKEFAKANKLSQESAQKMLDEREGLVSKAVESIVTKQNADLKAKTDGWLSEIKQIKSFDEDLKFNQQVLTEYFDPDFKKLLNETGLGNHPSLFKGFAKLGKAMNPQKFVKAPRDASAPKLEDWEVFYGPDKKSS